MVSLSSDAASAGIIVEAAVTPLHFGNSLHRAVRWLRAVFVARYLNQISFCSMRSGVFSSLCKCRVFVLL
jgi:hypothetical protein